MKATCPISGLSYLVSLPSSGVAKHPHPIFSTSTTPSTLVRQHLESWGAGTLTTEEIHLFGLALLMHLPLENIPSLPAGSHLTLQTFWEKYLDRLAKLAVKLEGKDFKQLPRLRVDMDSLECLPHWIDTLHTEVSLAFSPISEEAKKRNSLQYRMQAESKGTYSQEEIDSIVMRGLKGGLLSPKEARTFPQLMAQWACNVGEFPTAYVTLEDGRKIIIAQLWKDIIEKAFSKDGIYEVLSGDVTLADAEELLEYCYVEIPVGSLHASVLFKKLEEVREVLEEFRSGINPRPAKATKFEGTEDELLELLAGSESDTEQGMATRLQVESGQEYLSPSQKLAIRMAKIRSAK